MPVDPSISLGVGANVPKPQPLDPMALIGNLTQVQNQMNTNTQFKLTNAARQRAGQIIAGALDEDDAIGQLQGDKLVMGYYPEALKNIRDLQTQMATLANTTAETAGKRQGQVETALGIFAKSAPTLMALIDKNDMKALNAQIDANERASIASTTDPVARKAIKEGLASKRAALLEGLPDDPTAAQAELRMRLKGLLMGSGITPEVMQTYTGKPGTQEQGGGIQPTQTDIWTGVQKPIGPAIPKVTEPGYVDPATVQVPAGGPPRIAPIGMATKPAGAPGPQAAGIGAAPKLFDSAMVPNPPYQEPTRQHTVAGTPAKDTQEQKGEDVLLEKFNGDELKNFQANSNLMGRLSEMDTAFDRLQDDALKSGFLVPGTAASTRLGVANALNTVATVFGKDPIIDPAKTAAGALLQKDQIRSGFELSNSLGAREAVQVVNAAMAAVPGIENTYLGGKMLIDSLQTAAQYEMDRRQFKQEYSSAFGGLKGADEAFVQAHPIQQRMQAVLAPYGLDATTGGWLPLPAFQKAVGSNTETWKRMFPNSDAIQSYVDKGNMDVAHAEVVRRMLGGVEQRLPAPPPPAPLNTAPLEPPNPLMQGPAMPPNMAGGKPGLM